MFDISNCSKLRVIPSNVLLSLQSLEQFYSRNSSIQWQVGGQENQRQNTTLAELSQLNQLKTAAIDVPDVSALPSHAFFDKLEMYKVVIGDSNKLPLETFEMPNDNKASKSLKAFQLKDGTNSQKRIKTLFKGVQNLLLGELNGFRNAFNGMDLKEFPYLKHLSIINNLDTQYIIHSEDLLEAFPNLETLEISECHSLEEIVALESQENNIKKIGSDQLSPSFAFQNLIKLNVKNCGSLRYLLSFSMAACFANLNSLYVTGCEMMEEIITEEINTHEAKVNIFPKLKEFHLVCMERLTTIWHSQGGPFSYNMLDDVVIEECKNLVTIFPNHMMGRLSLLIKVKIVNCPLVKEIFDIRDTTQLNEAEVSIFPKLEELHLSHMERLTTMWHKQGGPDSYNMLDTVIIEECPKFATIFPNYMVGRISLLVRLKVVNCPSVQEIFDIKDTLQLNVVEKETCLRFIHLEALPNLKYIWNRDPRGVLSFKYLKKVWVSKCPNLKNLIPISIINGLEYSESLTVKDCNSIEEIVCRE